VIIMIITKDMLHDQTIEVLQDRRLAIYLAYPTCKRCPYVHELHDIGEARHRDIRHRKNDHAIGWARVGCNIREKCTLEKGRRYRFEPKARQPLVWMFPKLKVGESITFEPGEVGAGVEEPGKITIVDRGIVHWGYQSALFHEYFYEDSVDKAYDKQRLVVRGVPVPRIDPVTKKPIKGKFEFLWTGMIAKNNTPYLVTKRARRKGRLPPKEYMPIPQWWINENPDKWKEYQEWLKEQRKKLQELEEKEKWEPSPQNIFRPQKFQTI